MRIPFFKRHKTSPSPPPAPGQPLSALEDFETPSKTGHRLALHSAADIMAVLQEQTQRAFGTAGTFKTAINHESELRAQPALVDVRGYVLDDVLFLEQLLK
ncbi:hypothetical protein ABR738_01240 [Streptomyces sp. Edi4]|uniref:hypothetical protein n=1 Tax=Streptomyces sp. Edi4 TaxID=3162527 RepID=UPI0033060C1E